MKISGAAVAQHVSGKRPRRIFANITITAQDHIRSKSPSKSMNIILEFEGFVSSFCEPRLEACFLSSESKYRISEGSASGKEFDHLQNLGFPSLCPNTNVQYSLESGKPTF
ncbi:hypothetical protein CEXT_485871 [Caerostris extrusa]|uniref:Uncharacterized protein n=1 Tax=Caerostris extrusa TaxID=172846 RepID=A0AAV4R561_CAEEX|nr:hypothetical protein CEXT_485871 [Caerostris extrusa]